MYLYARGFDLERLTTEGHHRRTNHRPAWSTAADGPTGGQAYGRNDDDHASPRVAFPLEIHAPLRILKMVIEDLLIDESISEAIRT